MKPQIPNTFKVLIIGASRVGKTTAIQRFIDKKFIPQIRPTIGADFSLKTIQLMPHSDATVLTPISAILQLWDMAGEEYFHSILPYYITGTQGIILVCDATNPLTLLQLEEYIALINTYLDTSHIPSVLVSTKHDLPSAIAPIHIEAFMSKYRISEYFPTSAVTGLNIDVIFHRIGQLLAEKVAAEEA